MAELTIEVAFEERRGCGYRRAGPGEVRIYLMGPPFDAPCDRLPFPLVACPTCGGGIRQTRGFRWVDPAELISPNLEPRCREYAAWGDVWDVRATTCASCPLCRPGLFPAGEKGHRRAGLLWVGTAYYSTPESFLREARAMGVSKRLSAVPNGFRFGEDWALLAHPKAYPVPTQLKMGPGLFSAFQPTHVDLVVDTDDPEKLSERARRLAEKLGDKARLVHVVPVGEQMALV